MRESLGNAGRGYYAVRVGRKIGVFDSWSECEEHVRSYSGADYKKFKNLDDAHRFLNEHERNSHNMSSHHKKDFFQDHESKAASSQHVMATLRKSKEPTTTKVVLSSRLDLKNKFNLDPEDMSADRLTSKKKPTIQGANPVGPENTVNDVLKSTTDRIYEKVYVDGSALKNGSNKASAGIGVYWAEGDSRNLSEPLTSGPQTNQRAELTAAIRALETMDKSGQKCLIEILTDSKYVIHSMTQWRYQWKKNQWKNALGKQLKNMDLLQQLDHFCERHDVKWSYVPGHQGIYGNEMANKYAQDAAAFNKITRD